MIFVEVKEMKFSEKLQKLRKENKMSQEQLADQLEVSRQAVSKWESGQTYPEMDKLISLCKLFKCSLDDLTNDEVKEIRPNEKEKVTMNKLIDEVLDTISRSISIFKNLSLLQIGKYLLELLFLIFLLVLLRIPIDYIYQLGERIFQSFESPGLSSFFCSLWNFILSISYLIFSVICFYYLYKVLFLEKWETKTLEEKTKEKKESIKKEIDIQPEVISQEKKKIEKDEKSIKKEKEMCEKHSSFQTEMNTSMILKVLKIMITFFTKFCFILILLPFLFFFFFLIIAIVLGIYFIFQGILYFGFFGLLLGGFLLCYLIIEILFNIIANRKNSSKKIGILFLSSLIILGVGTALTLIEVSTFTYYDEIPDTTLYKKELVEKEFEMRENFTFDVIGSYDEIEYIPDSELVDTIKFQVELYSNFNKVHFDYENHFSNTNYPYLYILTEPKTHVFNSKMRNLILSSLKDKIFYNYGKLERIYVKVYTSQENIDKLHTYQKQLEEEMRKYDLAEERNYYESLLEDFRNQESIYEEIINQKEEENFLLQEKIRELEDKLEEMKEKLQVYKEQISSIITE